MKKLVLLVILLLGVKGFSQHPELFDREWKLTKMVFDGEDVYPPFPYIDCIVEFDEEFLVVFFQYCDDGYGGLAFYENENVFTLEDFGWALHGLCYGEEYDFMSLHYSIFAIHDEPNTEKNPFTYSIESDGDNYMLTIENGEGDIAVYGSVPLSQPEFSQVQLTLHPNPVSDVLHIHSTDMISKVSVYDIRGKMVKEIYVNSQNVEIDVSHLPGGLYFIKTKGIDNSTHIKRVIKK